MAWRDGGEAFEHPLEMGLVGKAAGVCDFRQWLPATQQASGMLDAAVEQIGVRGHVIVLAEGTDQVGR
ncbi:hypothetical protein D3C72_2039740 [compost metagenome]